jgi:glutamyl-Q tRNA(Asp) synthetase
VSGAKSSSAIATTSTAELPRRGYRGRFAPSPTGPLHFGSLVAAVGSYLEARSRAGEWLVRIEDLDPPRERPGAADDILLTLERLGLHPDGDVLRQSRRRAAYQHAFDRLRDAGRLRPCRCSRARLAALEENRGRPPGEELFHPPTCIDGANGAVQPAWRFVVPDEEVDFLDRVQGRQSENVARTCGDFVVRRRDGLFAYQLAVVVDDAAQGVTDVVRGMDLLGSTARQILLQSALGVPRPTYMHLPLALDASGVKLSKSAGAPAVSDAAPAAPIVAALRFLRQEPPRGLAHAPLEAVWAWAIANWRPMRLAGTRSAPAPEAAGMDGTMEGWE